MGNKYLKTKYTCVSVVDRVFVEFSYDLCVVSTRVHADR